jgi:hypothetical protein
MKKITHWQVTDQSENETFTHKFDRQRDAKAFEDSLSLFGKIKQAITESDVNICYDGMTTLFELVTDGLGEKDAKEGICPVFLDELALIMKDWKVTGQNEKRNAIRNNGLIG